MTMTEDERLLAEQIYEAVQDASTYSERSQQSADFRIGMSDLGWCSEKTRRMLAGIPEPVTDKLAAFIGTAVGDHVEQACQTIWPHAIRQAEVSVTITGDQGTYTVSGHPDLVLPEGLLIDVKTTRSLAVVERTGPSTQQQYQRHGYALGASEAGLFEVPLADVQVANVWFSRSADDKRAHVQMEPYNPEVMAQAGGWLDDVVYAYLHGEEARKEPPREVCWKVCGHAPDCRGRDTDVQGLITDPTMVTAADLYHDGLQLVRSGEQLKDEAKALLEGVNGSTGTWLVRWTTVGESEIHYTRSAYQRMSLQPVKPGKP